MIKYRKFFDDEFNNVSNPGNKTFHPVVLADPDGSEFNIKYSDEVVDIQENINSYRESCDINFIIDRFVHGDLNAITSIGVLDPEDKSIVDTTILPEDVHTLHDNIYAATVFYNGLPDEIRAKYPTPDDFYNNYDFDQVMAAPSDNSVKENINNVESEVE